MISIEEWEEFYKWCKSKYPMWSPDKMSVELFLEWSKNK